MKAQRGTALKPVFPQVPRPTGGTGPTHLVRLFADAPVYLEFAKKAFQRQLQYRVANYSGFAVNVFFLLIQIFG